MERVRCANDPELEYQGVVDVDAWSWDDGLDPAVEEDDWHVTGGPRSHAETDVSGAHVTFRRARSGSDDPSTSGLEPEPEGGSDGDGSAARSVVEGGTTAPTGGG